jgi:hypothetical protein
MLDVGCASLEVPPEEAVPNAARKASKGWVPRRRAALGVWGCGDVGISDFGELFGFRGAFRRFRGFRYFGISGFRHFGSSGLRVFGVWDARTAYECARVKSSLGPVLHAASQQPANRGVVACF